MAHKLIPPWNTHLIYDSVFQNSQCALDYLHYLRRLEQANITHNVQMSEFYNTIVLRLERSYNDYIPQMVTNLLRYFYEECPLFIPDAFVTPPTRWKHLQEPIVTAFKNKFPNMKDLSDCLEKRPNGHGRRKLRMKKGKKELLRGIKRILVIDDVLARGETLESAIFNLGQEKSYVSVCPLVVEQEDKFLMLKTIVRRILRLFGIG